MDKHNEDDCVIIEFGFTQNGQPEFRRRVPTGSSIIHPGEPTTEIGRSTIRRPYPEIMGNTMLDVVHNMTVHDGEPYESIMCFELLFGLFVSNEIPYATFSKPVYVPCPVHLAADRIWIGEPLAWSVVNVSFSLTIYAAPERWEDRMRRTIDMEVDNGPE